MTQNQAALKNSLFFKYLTLLYTTCRFFETSLNIIDVSTSDEPRRGQMRNIRSKFFDAARCVLEKQRFLSIGIFPRGYRYVRTIRSGQCKIPRVNNVYVKSPNARWPDILSGI